MKLRMPTMEEWKMIWGFMLQFITAFLALRIALGNVQEQSSFGLTQMISILAVFGGSWTQWAFSTRHSADGTRQDKTDG